MTNRLKQAWLALCGKLEREVRYVPNPAEWRNFYRAAWVRSRAGKSGVIRDTVEEYFHTCEQAHATHPGIAITTVIGFEIDGRTFIAPGAVTPIEVEPKPKVAKGKRK